MRLFLSSQDLGRYPHVAKKMAGANTKLAFIKNAQDDKPEAERNFSTPQKKLMFEQAGFEFEEIDLRQYFGKESDLRKKLEKFGVIWCNGGTTFILRRALAASGLDNLLVEWLREDKILYGGSSAGSCVAAEKLKGYDNKADWPGSDIVPKSYPDNVRETIWTGLGLVPFLIVPHADQDWYSQEFDVTITYLEKHKLQYRALEDGQVITVSGNSIDFLT